MDAKEQLYYLIKHYNMNNYDTKTFTDEFVRIYNLETDDNFLTYKELKLFCKLDEIAGRFAEEDEYKKYPSIYYSEKDVRQIAEKVYKELFD